MCRFDINTLSQLRSSTYKDKTVSLIYDKDSHIWINGLNICNFFVHPQFVYLAYGVSLTIVVVVAIVRAVFSQGSLWADDQPHHCMGVPDVTNTSMVANVTSYLAHTIDTSTEVPTGNSTESR